MILILGVTASGKGALGFELAKRIKGEIISIDSMKVYRRMDIGTAKPSKERQKQINYHLIDVVEPSESFSVDQFLDITGNAIEEIKSREKRVVAVGGTAMYIKTLLYGLFNGPGSNAKIRDRLQKEIERCGGSAMHRRLAEVDPDAAERIHPNDAKRIVRAIEVFELTGKPISSFQTQFNTEGNLDDWTIIGLRHEKAVESNRINIRVKKMINEGLVNEVKNLLAEEKPLSEQARCAIGYAEIIEHLNGKIALDVAIEQIKINTRRLAKGQRTWFKTFRSVNWLEITKDEPMDSIVERTIKIIEADETYKK